MSSDVESVSIPVLEEEVKLGREPVETGRVRVRTVTEERTEAVSEALLHTNVVVERMPIDREIDAVPPVREEGEALVVPVVEERLVKKLFLVEEVRLVRRASTEEFKQPVKLRSQRAIVERENKSGEAPPEE